MPAYNQWMKAVSLFIFASALAVVASQVLAQATYQPMPPSPPMQAEQPSYASSTPLVVIRFNQRKVFFEQQLELAAQRAMDVKPDVVFDLVSMVPISADPALAQRIANVAASNLRLVVDALAKAGVSPDKINPRSQGAQGYSFDEVHVFVR